jgi:hypothetical protein
MSSAKRSDSSSSKTSGSALRVQGGNVEKKKKEDWNDLIPGIFNIINTSLAVEI